MTQYTLPDLDYDSGALEPHLAGRILELHHGKHHAAYVAGANTVLEHLAEARSSGDFGAINQLEKNLAFHLSGHVMHSIFWRNLLIWRNRSHSTFAATAFTLLLRNLDVDENGLRKLPFFPLPSLPDSHK